jgi:hypothetical protein
MESKGKEWEGWEKGCMVKITWVGKERRNFSDKIIQHRLSGV